MENTAYASRDIVYLPVDKVMTNPYQPRKLFERNSLDELAESIREYGVLQPVSVRLINGYSYELVAGERRLRASKLAGLASIPAIVVNITDKDSAVLALIENLQRQDLHFLEEAEGFQNLIADYALTQEELAHRIGKSQSSVANKLRLLKLPRPVQKLLLEHELTERHARALLRTPDTQTQIDLLEQIVKHGLTVKQTEELVDAAIKKGDEPPAKSKGHVKHYIRDIRLLTNTIKQALDIMKSSGHDASYDVEKMDGGYEIKIYVRMGNQD